MAHVYHRDASIVIHGGKGGGNYGQEQSLGL